MIQRIQSIWLLLAAICIGLTFKFSVYSGTNVANIGSYQLNASENLVSSIITTLIIILTISNIFLFKKRRLQIKLCIVAIILDIILCILYYIELLKFTKGTYSLTTILNPMAILLFILAARAIYKDQKLVKSSDRLR